MAAARQKQRRQIVAFCFAPAQNPARGAAEQTEGLLCVLLPADAPFGARAADFLGCLVENRRALRLQTAGAAALQVCRKRPQCAGRCRERLFARRVQRRLLPGKKRLHGLPENKPQQRPQKHGGRKHRLSGAEDKRACRERQEEETSAHERKARLRIVAHDGAKAQKRPRAVARAKACLQNDRAAARRQQEKPRAAA